MHQDYEISRGEKSCREMKITKNDESTNSLNDITSKVKESECLIYENNDSQKMAKSYLDKYLVDINNYQNNPNCKIYPKLHLDNTKEIKNFIIKEKICVNTYYQYIDVYKNLGSESEEIKYDKSVTTNEQELNRMASSKNISIPLSTKQDDNPNYNIINMKYIMPKIVNSQIPVVVKKKVYPQIETTNEEIEIEVEKYVPHIIPVNVYVPRYYSISALEGEEVQVEFKDVELTKEQEENIIKELNPHLEDIKMFNEEQTKKIKHTLNISKLKADKLKIKQPEHELIVYYDNGTSQSFDFEMFEKFQEMSLEGL
ncbi:PhIL1 interacting protein PIP2, putative [Plasmodium chabaudi chabaudi]|uniref:PhIL1 interacting protein PIP2, putative n=1 Tax=Plasmodium chabaudi chabaudi TaxID=31271 RepID=A0A4V0K217_PLACU|nr:PhIL1 interacting protein PIP2, putative [Plasmodium chabaudi chabaudi]VTZ66480.1 PhIL1 interacting protein PIP2, putative [Plasmodium chabaudi chabaudi]|eukprot:XP_745797.2 conserved Plasmodium protein, unknown function [Plasmodium chabaudi chabaudi]